MKTYLYNRVSSGRQNRPNKDGLARQSESAEVVDFIKNHKLNVVKTMEYIGSSFAGKNFDGDTVLGKFIAEVKSGKIPTPVCLCFENWDRFGRDIEWKNTKRFLDLIEVGVSIGVVSMDIIIDQSSLAKNSDILQLVVNDIQRARKESERKSGFSKRNLSVKVSDAKKGISTAVIPVRNGGFSFMHPLECFTGNAGALVDVAKVLFHSFVKVLNTRRQLVPQLRLNLFDIDAAQVNRSALR